MKFSQFAGTSIVPTLARLVLALAFTTVGYSKLTDRAEVSDADAAILKNLGVPVTSEALLTRGPTKPSLMLASLRQDPPASGEPEPDAEPEAEQGEAERPQEQPVDPPAERDEELESAINSVTEALGLNKEQEQQQTTEPPAEEPAEPEATVGRLAPPPTVPTTEPPELDEGETVPAKHTTRRLYQVTLLCEQQGWPYPVILGWAAALTEFVGGGLLLVGFLSRVWGLGLAITMGVAVYLTTLQPYLDLGPFTVADGSDGHKLYHRVFTQLGLFVLALSVFLTGPGPISIDRLLFRRQRRGHAVGELLFDDDSPDDSHRPV